MTLLNTFAVLTRDGHWLLIAGAIEWAARPHFKEAPHA
jgi:hypothetical protein